jgi:hypothetical protein
MGQVRRYDPIGPSLEHAANIDARRPRPIGLTVDQVQSTGRRQEAREPVSVTRLTRETSWPVREEASSRPIGA